jgi:carbamoyl-phosphate synthase large subunit
MTGKSTNSGVHLLFLCGGRRVKLLKSFRAALSQANGGLLLTTDTERVSATAFVSDGTFSAPPCSDVEAFAAQVAEICSAEQVTAVIPLTCAGVATVPVLRSMTDTLIVSGNTRAVEICTDKKKTYEFLSSLSIPTPEFFSDPRPDQLPVFFRGRFSEGSRDACAVRSVSALENLKRRPHGIFTQHVSGREFTIDGYKDLQGRIVCLVSRERLRVRAGEVEKSLTSLQPELLSLVHRAVEALDFVGPITVQAIESEGGFYLTELNLRYGGGVTLSISAGMNSPEWLIQELRGGGAPPSPEIRWGLGMVRYDEEFYFSDTEDSFKSKPLE